MSGIKRTFLSAFLILSSFSIVLAQNNVGQEKWLEGEIIFKVKKEYRSFCKEKAIAHNGLNELFSRIQTQEIQKKFPLHKAPAKRMDSFGRTFADLSTIYFLSYAGQIHYDKVIYELMQTGIVEYAVPVFIPVHLYDPNDPSIGSQYHIPRVLASAAWNITKGDTNVIIGILDSGTDIDHPDLVNNIAYNYDDPIDGIDNDNDGYVDNFRGWDIGMNDNDPNIDNEPHGIHVSGLASAHTDNGIGIAGLGFNCRFLPVKVTNLDGEYISNYEGIVYAADHGCQVINCSWGGTYGMGPYGQDIITYATVNKDAVVVAAAGNDNNDVPFYPASYKYVLSVGATDGADLKSNTSSFGYTLDLMAPGKNVYSTWDNGSYLIYSGTSMSAPIVSGILGLVRSAYPELSAQQAAEKVRVSSDDIYSISGNAAYQDLMGKGRANAFAALNDTVPSLRILSSSFDDHNDGYINAGDTLDIVFSFVNWLAEAQNVSISISCNQSWVQVLSPTVFLGGLDSLEVKDNSVSPFKIVIDQIVPGIRNEIQLKVSYQANNYQDFEFNLIPVNPDYITVDTNEIEFSLAGRGKLGYADNRNTKGVGFRYRNGKSLMYNGGFIIGASAAQVSDVSYGSSGGFDEDFFTLQAISETLSPVNADVEYQSFFSDSLAGIGSMNLIVRQNLKAWNTPGDEKFVILEYQIVNTGQGTYQTLYAGLFIDWDILDYRKNGIHYDAGSRMSYAYSYEGGPMAAIKMITPGTVKHYAFNSDGSLGSINLYDGFSPVEKFQALRTIRDEAGYLSPGTDVADMISTGPVNLGPGDTITIAYALIAGDHIADIQSSAQAAHDKYYPTGSIAENDHANAMLLPNPASENCSVLFTARAGEQTEVLLYDSYGRIIREVYNGRASSSEMNIRFTVAGLENGLYYCVIRSGKIFISRKLLVNN